MDKKTLFAVIIIVCLVLLVAIFGSGSISGLFLADSVQSVQGDSLKLGVIGVLSGPVALSWGIDAKNGITLAVEDAKKLYDLNIQVISGDSAASPEEGISEFRRINSIASPDVFIVEASAVASAIAPLAKDYGKPIMFTATAAENITSANDLLFRNFYLCEEEAPFMAKRAIDLNIQKIVVLFQKEPFGESCSKLFISTFESLGGKIVSTDSFLPTDLDFRTQLLKIKNLGMDSIYAVGYENQMLGIVKQMNEMDINKIILAGRLIFTPAIRGQVIEYTKGKKVFFGGNDFYLDSKEALEFSGRYFKKYGKMPSHVAAYAYDSVLLIASAYKISNAKSILLKAALKEAKISGVNGDLSFNSKRETSQPAYLLTINASGKAEIVK
ncbi:MAG: ABC transporter substrate-binding protein [archaeon]|jgi:branched-chain amino acid transport system substrate-binding protein